VILIVGLGNPGPRYTATRHNVGFRVVERLVERARGGPFRDKFQGQLASLSLGSVPCLALLPQTFMNESGRSVRACAAFYKLTAADVAVVHDELDVPLGEVRLKLGGGDAGHRGIRSIAAELGSQEFVRVRVGIGRPPPDFRGDPADYVLDGFPLADQPGVEAMLDRAVEAITLFVERGLSSAMNVINQRKP
jgi:PTH1 family peptidyl-tRNA hydrolase